MSDDTHLYSTFSCTNILILFTDRQIQSILDDKSTPYEGEEKLASLTAGERTHWAKTREEHFSKGINKHSLDAIEKSAFVVALDDVPYEFDKVRFRIWFLLLFSIFYISISYFFFFIAI